jgi:hypothetical protein
MSSLEQCIAAHFQKVWRSTPVRKSWTMGPFWELPASFHVLEFPPNAARALWTYATCGMSRKYEGERLELYLLSPMETDAHVELLTAIAHYHFSAASLSAGHIVRFGRPWLEGSMCERGLISLPYLDGPSLEYSEGCADTPIRCLWLLPITEAERQFMLEHGQEALERRFDESQLDYANPNRPSVV